LLTGPKKVVKAGQSRFGEKTKLFGTTPNDLKVSAKDTDGALSVLTTTDGKRVVRPCTSITNRTNEIYYVLAGTYRFALGDEQHTLTAGDLIFAPVT
jgi:mannose-6-phosphate isomerase-like protein (cupin superfamily)